MWRRGVVARAPGGRPFWPTTGRSILCPGLLMGVLLMARTPKKAKKAPGPPVYRFVKYGERWGNTKCDKVPQFIKWYLNGWDGAGGEVLGCINQLRAESNDIDLRKDFIWLQGSMLELLVITTNTHKQYQGYLLTGQKCPATASEIGRMVRVKGRGGYAVSLAFLKTLIKVGLLEVVPWVEPGSILDKPSPPPSDVTIPKAGKGPAKKPRSRQKKEDKALKDKGKDKGKEKSNREGQAKPETQAQERAAPLGHRPNLEPRREGESQAKFLERRKCELGEQFRAPMPMPPATIPAIDATSATNHDAGEGLPVEQSNPPHVDSPSPAVNIIQFHKLDPRRYSDAGWDVADAVMRAVGYPAQGPGDVANERARWAGAWDESIARGGADSGPQLESKLMKKAAYVRRIRHTKNNPEAYLRTILQNLVRDVLRAQKGATA